MRTSGKSSGYCNFSRERIEHEILLGQMTMENWDATHDDEKIEKLSQIIQLISIIA
jgi:hypothetical protein